MEVIIIYTLTNSVCFCYRPITTCSISMYVHRTSVRVTFAISVMCSKTLLYVNS